jgi:hypothetical protein
MKMDCFSSLVLRLEVHNAQARVSGSVPVALGSSASTIQSIRKSRSVATESNFIPRATDTHARVVLDPEDADQGDLKRCTEIFVRELPMRCARCICRIVEFRGVDVQHQVIGLRDTTGQRCAVNIDVHRLLDVHHSQGCNRRRGRS